MKHWVLLSSDFYSLPLAYHLQEEDQHVVFGMTQSRKELGLKEKEDREKPEEKEQRLSNHDGMIDKKTATQVLNMLAKVKKTDQDDYFFFFDFSETYRLAEMILKMGFKNGLFPTKFYYDMERDRKQAKAFTQKHYPDLMVAESKDFKSADDGVDFLSESDEFWVLKSNGSVGKTVVPPTKDVKIARMVLSDALQEHQKEYEQQGYLLEKMIVDCQEITPVMVFWQGEPVYSLVEFENKSFGSGNIGVLKGGNQALSIRTKLDCRINRIAFPPKVFELAQKQPGLSIYDAGLLFKDKKFFFTEWCAMRYGFDGCYGEIVMRDDGEPFVTNYFEDIMAGRNPLIKKYGAYVRLFSIAGDYETTGKPKDDLPVYYYKSIENNLFLYSVKKLNDKIVTVGGADFVGVMTASSDEMEASIKKVYKNIDKFYFGDLYYRPLEDFLSKDYPSSIMIRIDALKEWLV